VGNRGGGTFSRRDPYRAPDGHTSCLGRRRGRHRPSAHAGYLQVPDRGGHPYAGED